MHRHDATLTDLLTDDGGRGMIDGRRAVAWLSRENRWSTVSTNRFAVVSLSGGLGNQMFQFAAARALCRRESRRLWLGWGLRRDESPRRFSLDAFRLFDDPDVTMLDRAAERRLGVRMPEWRRRLTFSPKLEHVYEPSFSFTALNGSHHGIVLHGFFQSWRYFADDEPRIRTDFTLRTPVMGANADRLRQIERTNAIAVQIRRGDYASDARARAKHGVLGLDYYQEALSMLADQEHDARVFVFTDEPEWARIHFSCALPTCVIDQGRDDQPWEDLRLMAACRHFVIANSTFGWWGAWLSSHARKRVVAPKRWFAAGGLDTRDLCPEDWIRL